MRRRTRQRFGGALAWLLAITAISVLAAIESGARAQRAADHGIARWQSLLVRDEGASLHPLRYVETTARGYSGPLRLVVGVDAALCMRAIGILQSSETPGIGAPRLQPAALRAQLGRCGTTNVAVDAATGATLTDKAIAQALAAALTTASADVAR